MLKKGSVFCSVSHSQCRAAAAAAKQNYIRLRIHETVLNYVVVCYNFLIFSGFCYSYSTFIRSVMFLMNCNLKEKKITYQSESSLYKTLTMSSAKAQVFFKPHRVQQRQNIVELTHKASNLASRHDAQLAGDMSRFLSRYVR